MPKRLTPFSRKDNKLIYDNNGTNYYYQKGNGFILNKDEATEFTDLELTSEFLSSIGFPYYYSEDFSIVYNETQLYSFSQSKFLSLSEVCFSRSSFLYMGLKTYFEENNLNVLLNYLYFRLHKNWKITVKE